MFLPINFLSYTIYPLYTPILKKKKSPITKWFKFQLQSGAEITKWLKKITKWCRNYKVAQNNYKVAHNRGLHHLKARVTKWGKGITKWGKFWDYKVGQAVIKSGTVQLCCSFSLHAWIIQ